MDTYVKTWEFFQELGYKPLKNLFTAPYDFRYGPNDNPDFTSNFTSLIEMAYSTNNNTKVTVIGHSYGCQYSLTFF